MASAAVSSFLDALRANELLPAARLEEVTREGARFEDSRGLAKHLLQRGWLTPFQANHLVQGRAAELVLGAYLLVERLGEGQRGQVYRAKHRRMKRGAAVKVVRKDLLADPTAVAQFYQGVQVASSLDHPNIVHAYDAGPAGPTHFLAMEFIQGTDLCKLLQQQKGPLPPEQAAAYVIQTALGLQHAGERGLAHLDIKPSNLIVTGQRAREPSGKPDLYAWGIVKILDFGLARMRSAARTGSAAEFLAPELAAGKAADSRADIYSLGCTLYFLLTGKVPAPVGQAVTPIEQLRPKLPAELVEVVHYLMAPRPEDRIQTPQEVAVVLAGLFDFALCGPVVMPGAGLEDSGEVPIVSRSDDSTIDGFDVPSVAEMDPEARARERRLLVIAGMGLVLGLLSLTIFLLYPRGGEHAAEATKPSPAAGNLRELIGKARENPAAGDLWPAFYELSARYPDTPEGKEARDWLLRVPSPLDTLNATRIPAEERYPWQPKELVSVLGEHRYRGWGGQGRCVAYHPKTPMLASGDAAGAYLWDTATGRLLHHLRVTGYVNGIAFAPDGETLLTAGSDKTVKHWQVSSGQLLATFGGYGEQVQAVAFAPDGESFASGSTDKTVRVWTINPKKEIAQFKDHKATVHAVAYSPDGQTLASASSDHTVKIWDLKARKAKHSLAGPKPMLAVAFAPVGSVLAGGGADFTVRLWDPESGEELNSFKKHSSSVAALAFAPDGLTLASGAHDTQVRFWDMTTRTERPYQMKGLGTVTGLSYAPDNQSLAATTSYTMLRLGDPATGTSTWTPRGHTHLVKGTAVAPDGRTIATASHDTTVKLWDPAGSERLTLTGLSGAVDDVAFSPDGQTVAAVGRYDKLVRLWDAATGQSKRELKGHDAGIHCVTYSPDGKFLATAGADKTVRLWDGSNGKEIKVIPAGTDNVQSLAFAPNSSKLAWCGPDKTVRAWDIPGDKSAGENKLGGWHLNALAFTPDGATLAVGHDRHVRLLDAASLKDKGTIDAQGVVAGLAYSPDGQWLVATCTDGRCSAWKATTRTKVKDWLQPGSVYGVAAAPDGRHFVTANGNGTAYVLRLAPLTVRGEKE